MPDGQHQRRTDDADKPDLIRRMITRSATPFALALIVGFARPLRAELLPDPVLPHFSTEDLTRIERNATLRELYLHNPWLTFRVLQSMDEAVASRRDLLPGPASSPAASPFDEKRDPDLGELQRVAPEAAVDLFAMIKKASTTNPK